MGVHVHKLCHSNVLVGFGCVNCMLFLFIQVRIAVFLHDIFRLFAFSAYAFLVHQRVFAEWFSPFLPMKIPCTPSARKEMWQQPAVRRALLESLAQNPEPLRYCPKVGIA